MTDFLSHCSHHEEQWFEWYFKSLWPQRIKLNDILFYFVSAGNIQSAKSNLWQPCFRLLLDKHNTSPPASVQIFTTFKELHVDFLSGCSMQTNAACLCLFISFQQCAQEVGPVPRWLARCVCATVCTCGSVCVCVWRTLPTEVECSCTSSRKFPSRLQSAMTDYSSAQISQLVQRLSVRSVRFTIHLRIREDMTV